MKKQKEGRKNLNDDMEKKVMILGAILSTMPCYSWFFLLSKYYVSWSVACIGVCNQARAHTGFFFLFFFILFFFLRYLQSCSQVEAI